MMDNGPTRVQATRRVVCAAIRNTNGTIICGVRHWDELMRSLVLICGHDPHPWDDAEQGFVDNHGVFMDGFEAWSVALVAGQIIRHVEGDHVRLHTENLY